MNYIFTCSNCRKLYTDYDPNLVAYCSVCNNRLLNTSITDDQWCRLTENDKNHFIEYTIVNWNDRDQWGIEEKPKKNIEKQSLVQGTDNFENTTYYGLIDVMKNSGITDTCFDPYFAEAARMAVEDDKASIGFIQRKFKIGFNRAARIMDQLYEAGIVAAEEGIKPRRVLIRSLDELYRALDEMSISIDNENAEKRKEQEEIRRQEVWKHAVMDTDLLIRDRFDVCRPNWEGLELSSEVKENVLLRASTDDDQHNYIANLIINNSPEILKLIVFGRLFEVNGLAHMLFPVASDNSSISKAIEWTKKEVNERLEQMAISGKRSFESYNEYWPEKKPYIVVIFDEIYDLISDSSISTPLLDVLRLGKKCGVFVTAFTEFSEKSLQLGPMKDLFRITESASYKLTQSYSKEISYNETSGNISIEEIDNRMSGRDFELFSRRLLEANGFHNIEVTKSSGDYGGDVTAYKDDIKYTIQCKKYSTPVGIDAVQEVIGSRSIYDCHVGVVLTNNSFTNAAIELARKNLVILWDRSKLLEMMKNI